MRVFLAATLLILSATAHADAGLGFSISKTALDKTTDLITGVINNYFADLYLPNLNFSIPVKDLGTVDLQLTNLTLQNLHVGSAAFNLTAPSGFGVTLGPFGVDLSSNFAFSVPEVPALAGTGTLTAAPTDGNITATMEISVASGSLAIQPGPTYVNVGNLHVMFEGNDAWLYNLLYGDVSSKLTAALNSAVVSALEGVDADLNNLVQKIPRTAVINLGSDFDLALDLTFARADVTPTLFDIADNLLFTDAANGVACPLPRFPLPQAASNNPDAEFQLFISDTIVSCPLWVLYANGALDATITPASSPSLAKYLNTSIFQDILPPIYNAFPNDALKLAISLEAPFTLNTSATDGFVATAPLEVNMTAETATGDAHVATLGLSISIGLDVHVTSAGTPPVPTIGLNMTDLALKLSVVDSAVGTLDVAGLNALLALAGPVLEETVNKDLAKIGIALSPVFGISLKDPTVAYQNGSFALAGSIQFQTPVRL